MLKKLILFILLVVTTTISANAGNKIKVYFNQPVDNSVSTGVNAVYLSSSMADTVVAYINRAKYTIDVAVYNFTLGSYANIATAINNAYTKGVKIRWIYDSSSSNTALAGLNPGIFTLGSPMTGASGIMHNKFMIIDAYSSNPADAIIWTGATNWGTQQFNTDYNNAVVIQDSALAHAYTDHFNMMWGGSGIAPNLSLSKFGNKKTDLGRHTFTIEGHLVELYFSPADTTNTKIQNAISSASKDLYFGIYAFTDNSDASLIMSKNGSGVYVAGICDNFSNTYSPHSMFASGLGSRYILYSGTGLYHNKFLIVDPSDRCSDPLVLTGSHNWSISANTINDENTLIIHSDTVANIFYQSFKANFNAFGGTLSKLTGCPMEVPRADKATQNVLIYPNPANDNINISYNLTATQNVNIALYNIIGGKVATLVSDEPQPAGDHLVNYSIPGPGMYIVQFKIGNEHYTRKIVVQN